jgi:Carboxypeptidase regulatory-like domain
MGLSRKCPKVIIRLIENQSNPLLKFQISELRGCVLLTFILLLMGCARRIPPEYEYPQGWITNLEEDHAIAQSLSGVVNDGSGMPIRSVLVERMTPDFKRRIAATLTDEKGTFRFRHRREGSHYLRFRFRGFNDYEIPVTITPKAKKRDLTVRMSVSG